MARVIDPETLPVDELPGVWAPVQWELEPEERIQETEAQASANLLANVDVPEALLRLLLNDTSIERAYAPPEGYDPQQQGEWDPDIITFVFSTSMTLVEVQREPDHLVAIYQFANHGMWRISVEPERVLIERV